MSLIVFTLYNLLSLILADHQNYCQHPDSESESIIGSFQTFSLQLRAIPSQACYRPDSTILICALTTSSANVRYSQIKIFSDSVRVVSCILFLSCHVTPPPTPPVIDLIVFQCTCILKASLSTVRRHLSIEKWENTEDGDIHPLNSLSIVHKVLNKKRSAAASFQNMGMLAHYCYVYDDKR